MTKEVVKKEEENLALIEEMSSKCSVTGFESMSSKDMEIPFLTILESGSPQCKKSNDQYIPGASEGMILDTFTNEIFDGDTGINIIPCFFEKVILEWKPERGGLAGIHPIDTHLMGNTEKDEKGRNVLGNGNSLVETAQYYVLHVKKDKTIDKCCISMSSTRLKCSRRWNRVMSLKRLKLSDGTEIVPPSFSYMYNLKLSGKQEGNNSWWVWEEDSGTKITDINLFKQAKALAEECYKGLIKVAVHEQDDIPF